MTEIYVKKYVSDEAEEVSKALDGKINLVTATLGSGKTTFIWNNYKDTNTIFALPSIQQLRELETTLEKNNISHKRFGGGKGRGLRESELGGFCISTHNQIVKISKERAKDITLVFDEAHTLITDKKKDFKKDILSKIYNLLPYFKKVILLTATPHPLMINPIFDKHIEIKVKEPLDFSRVKIIGCISSFKSGMYRAEKLIKENPTSTIVIKYNNTEKLKIIRKYLIEKTELASKNIIVYNAKTRDEPSEEFPLTFLEYLEKDGRFPSEVKVVCTTSAIEEGLNLYFVPDLVINIQEANPVKLKQFVGRFRNGYGDYLILLNDKKERSVTIPTVESTVNSINQECKKSSKLVKTLNKEVSEMNYSWNTKQTKHDSPFDVIHLNSNTDLYEVDECFIMWKHLDRYFYLLAQSPRVFHDKLENVYDFSNCTIEYSSALQKLGENVDDKSFIIDIIKNKSEVLSSDVKKSLDDIFLLFTGTNRKIVQRYLELSKKVSRDFILELIDKDTEELKYFFNIDNYAYLLALKELKESGYNLTNTKEEELLEMYLEDSFCSYTFNEKFPTHIDGWLKNGVRDNPRTLAMKMSDYLKKYFHIKGGGRIEIDGKKRQVKEVIYKPRAEDFHEDIYILIDEKKAILSAPLFPSYLTSA